MATTGLLGLIIPDENTPASINATVAALGGSVDAKVGPYASDTGWINVTPMNGFTGTLAYRKIGKFVEVTAIGNATFPNGGGLTIGNLPTAVRPIGTRRGACWLTGNNVGTVGTTASGNIDINHNSGASRGNVQASMIYSIA